ncbi:DinB family protein [Cytobacillus sp. Sa5YUA1]|uniref:DinB family protein n=1 Tax=Cytobacillus stercorigallinarum TaxID=2762240 RepID=A0ABR8QIT8_9BACI|nr:DinB family protein [Cytobacillus stercorigallinarum]MBD7935424.1 DinB family protein [Cytobacillus stercorigallinarum]
MAEAREVLCNQLAANADDPSWYTPFLQTVDEISEEEAFMKLNSKIHSIAEITQHLIYWNEVWHVRFKDNDVGAIKRIENNDLSFVVPKGKTFSDLKASLLVKLQHWQKTLTTNELLDQHVKGFPVTAHWWAIIANVTSHNAYHIGQIAYLKKIIKSSY